MVISSNRSPSPISSRTTNPNPRTPESSNNIRKSFTGNPLKKPLIVRNSKSFNPVTPANSPAEFLQRNSSNKEGISSLRVSYEYKENEKDQNLKSVKIRSPSVSGSKNFMAPTISTVSKIAASPRKKILGERNEFVRSSDSSSTEKLSFSERIELSSELVSCSQVPPKILSFDLVSNENLSFLKETGSNVELGSGSQVPSETLNASCISETSNITSSIKIPDSNIKPFLDSANPPNDDNLNSEASSVTQNFSESEPGNEGFKLKPSSLASTALAPLNSEVSSVIQNFSESEPGNEGFKLKPSSSPSPLLAPLDLDPSLPPYDPKTNYLSPRPLFLRYKPNPRIEVYLNKELGFNPGEGKRLEDSFTSESCSDAETTEETQNSESQKQSEDELSEAISEEEKQTHIEEKQETVRPKEISKSHSFVRSKIIPFLLVFVIASLCFTVTDSPLYTPSTLKDQTFSKLETSAKMEVNSIDLVYNLKLWFEKSTSYLSRLNSISRVEKMGPLYAVNLTILDQEVLLHEYPAVHYGDNETEEKQERNGFKSQEEKETEEESWLRIDTEEKGEELIMEEVKEPEIFAQAADIKPKMLEPLESQEEGDLEDNADSNSLEEKQEENGLEPRMEPQTEDKAEEEKDCVESQIEETDEEIITEELKEESLLISLAAEIEPKMVESVEFQDEDGIDSHTNVEPANLELTPHNSDSDSSPQSSAMDASPQNPGLGALESVIHDLADKFLKQTVLQISLALLTLITGSAFLYVKKTTSAEAEITVKQLQPNKLVFSSLSASIDSKKPQIERFCSQNWATEEEIAGQSGPSEMSSSFQNSSSCRQWGSDRENEVQSHKSSASRNRNRESSLEYSAGSPSYGSFTTYEKIYRKHGCGEEVVTPVRRSSRIKKQIISP
ncbi:hypothetical protein BVC80_393g10 [Macleaya cordata]|uniref:Transmembrane protein n=1 Tax=Macleaya cordata TaxID=56857 RepID=A0A200R180_MACCD|nr:hypothetical protein BVC80_393g10 [Macleaya cordata]